MPLLHLCIIFMIYTKLFLRLMIIWLFLIINSTKSMCYWNFSHWRYRFKLYNSLRFLHKIYTSFDFTTLCSVKNKNQKCCLLQVNKITKTNSLIFLLSFKITVLLFLTLDWLWVRQISFEINEFHINR